MIQTRKIAPLTATLICINSMIGAGLFINPKPLAALAGAYGFLGYVIAASIFFPLIWCIAELAALHPIAGGLYMYSHTHLGPWAGFLSGWGYFVGKTTSVALLIHKFVEFFQPRVAVLADVPTLLIDFCMFFFLVALNSAGVSIGGRVQYLFSALKATPILFAFGIGAFCFDPTNFKDVADVHGILSTIPIAIFALVGFEVICAVANMVEDAANNIKRIILTAFVFVTSINILFQLTMVGILGNELKHTGVPLLAVGLRAFEQHSWIANMVNGFVFASIVGGCFSLLTSNCWNLHTIARFGHFPGASLLMRVNTFNVPWVSILVEACLGCIILFMTVEQTSLQNMAVFAQIVCYFLSALAAWYAVKSGALKRLAWWVPLLAMLGCTIIMGIALHNIIMVGVSFSFLFLLLAGVAIAVGKKLFVAQ